MREGIRRCMTVHREREAEKARAEQERADRAASADERREARGGDERLVSNTRSTRADDPREVPNYSETRSYNRREQRDATQRGRTREGATQRVTVIGPRLYRWMVATSARCRQGVG